MHIHTITVRSYTLASANLFYHMYILSRGGRTLLVKSLLYSTNLTFNGSHVIQKAQRFLSHGFFVVVFLNWDKQNVPEK